MLRKVFKALDMWIGDVNTDRRAESGLELRKATIQIVGQTALLESKLKIELLATADVDAYLDAEYEVRRKFDALLQEQGGQYLDPHSAEVWMPAETRYDAIYSGKFVEGLVAQPEYVLLSKALKAPGKNEKLIVDYLASGPTRKFISLATKYELDLEQFI